MNKKSHFLTHRWRTRTSRKRKRKEKNRADIKQSKIGGNDRTLIRKKCPGWLHSPDCGEGPIVSQHWRVEIHCDSCPDSDDDNPEQQKTLLLVQIDPHTCPVTDGGSCFVYWTEMSWLAGSTAIRPIRPFSHEVTPLLGTVVCLSVYLTVKFSIFQCFVTFY